MNESKIQQINEKKKKKKRKKLKVGNFILLLLLIIASGVLVYSCYKIVTWGIDNEKTNEVIENIGNPTTEIKDDEKTETINPPEDKFDPYWDYIKISLIDVDFNELLAKNTDTVGWVYVGGTNINYPVVQTHNNEYYLTHSFDETWNDAG